MPLETLDIYTGQVTESANPVALLSFEVLAPCVDRRRRGR